MPPRRMILTRREVLKSALLLPAAVLGERAVVEGGAAATPITCGDDPHNDRRGAGYLRLTEPSARFLRDCAARVKPSNLRVIQLFNDGDRIAS